MIVSPAEKNEILKLLLELDVWVSANRPGLPVITRESSSIQDRYVVRQELYANPDLFDAFLQANGNRLTAEERKLVASWKGFVQGRLILVKDLKSGAVLTDNQRYYLVLGLAEPVAELGSRIGLRVPMVLQTTLLPFRGRIVYDGLVAPLNVHFGGGARANILADYAAARREGRIVTSLDGTSVVAPPASRELDYLQTLRQIRDSVEKLRGRGSREIQSPALALLRWSAEIAVSAFEDELDRPAIRKELGQLKRAYTQLTNAFYDF